VYNANGLDPAWQNTVQWANLFERYVVFGTHPLFIEPVTEERVEQLAAYQYVKNNRCENFYSNDASVHEEFEKHRKTLFNSKFRCWIEYALKHCSDEDKSKLKEMVKGGDYQSNQHIFPTDIERRRALNVVYADWKEWENRVDHDRNEINWRSMCVFTKYRIPWYVGTDSLNFYGGCTWCLSTELFVEPMLLDNKDEMWVFMTCHGCQARFRPSVYDFNNRGYIRATNLAVYFQKAQPMEKRWTTTKRARVLVEEQEERDVKKQKTQ